MTASEAVATHLDEIPAMIPMEPQPKLPWLLTFKDSDLWLYQTL